MKTKTSKNNISKNKYRICLGITIVCEYILLAYFLYTFNYFLLPTIVWAGLQGLFILEDYKK